MSEIASSKPAAHTQGAANAFGFAPDLADFGGAWFAAAMQNSQAWQSEMLGFLTRRLEQDRVAWARFAECRSPLDVAKVQQDWFAQSIEAYADEGRRFAAIAQAPVESSPKAKAAPKPQAVA